MDTPPDLLPVQGLGRPAQCTLPLIKRLPDSVTQVWYADVATALGHTAELREWWDELGPGYGYYPNPSKTWLVTKEECHADAMAAFEGTKCFMYGR